MNLMAFIITCKRSKSASSSLMIIPPNDNNTEKYFKSINQLNNSLSNELSMGMSSDYIEAAQNGASFVRVGSSILGPILTIVFVLTFLIILKRFFIINFASSVFL